MKEKIAPFRQRRADAISARRRAARLTVVARTRTKKKAARFPRRPFLSHGSATLTGDLRTSAPGAYLPAVS